MSSPSPRYPPLSEATRARLAPYVATMGKRPDGEIARAAGLDRRCVVVYRHYAGIPPYQRGHAPAEEAPAPAVEPSPGHRRSRLDRYRHLMGDVSDGRIAELAGCSREAVMRYRSRYGIPAAGRGAPPASPEVARERPPIAAPPAPSDELPPEADEVLARAPKARPADTRGGVRHGYLVVAERGGERVEFLVLGSDIAAAADRALGLLARALPGGAVVEVRHRAEVLA